MKALDARVAKLESRRGPHLPPVAVVSALLPLIADAGWGAGLLRFFGWEGHELAVVVQQGNREVLLEPLPYAWVKGDAERIWLGTADQYPQAWIMSGLHGCLAQRFESEADLRCWMVELERELAA